MNAQLAFELPAPDLEKARARRRASVAKDIDDGLICDTPAARTTDPNSSHVAAEFMRVTGAKASHQHRILDVVRRLPGLTVIEIGKQAGLTDHQVGRRMHELVTALKIRAGEERYIQSLSYTTYWPT